MKIYTVKDKNVTVDQVGGKGLNLLRLTALDMNVPPFVVIDQAELEHIIPADLKKSGDVSKIHSAIDAFEMNTLKEDIASIFPDSDQKLFAVRSSAVMEDGQKHSFAGQFETHLYVSFDDIPKFVKSVWKSNFSERVFSYLESNNLQPAFGIGVIIQEMIDPDVSGVAFGIDPSTGAKDSKLICSVYGVGEGLVSGSINADTYKLNGAEIQKEITEKNLAAKKLHSGETRLTPVPETEWVKSSLSDEQVKEISNTLNVLNEKLGSPQDIEFAYKNRQLFLLQTRPVTAVIKGSGSQTVEVRGNRIIWDNSNIIESYPGVTTPLTFSYISDAYKQVYLQLASIMGASDQTLKENEATFANMLGMINGRVYYNLLSWYKVLALFPGFQLNARFMENMMGVKERFDLPPTKKKSKIGALYRTFIMICRIIGNLFTIKKTTRQFYRDMNRVLDEVKSKNLESMHAWQLKETWLAVDADLTPKWKAPLINDSFAMIYFGKLQKLVEKYNISDNKNIQNDLLCGSKDIISVEPIHRSIALATEIGQDAELKKLFSSRSENEIREELQAQRQQQLKYKSIAEKIDLYIDKFGERCVGELKLETISFKQDPTLFISTLKSFVLQNVTTTSTASTVDKDLRDAAEAELNRALRFKPYKKWKLNRTLKKARYFVSNRENLRYERTRIFGFTREIFSLIGKQFEQHKILHHHRDIFYLTKEEIFSFIDGTSVDKDLKGLVNFRKAEYKAFEEMEAPADRITTYETVNANNDFFVSSGSGIATGDLKGLGCCPGIVRKKVRLVKHPKEVESLDGDILVTSSTDPGWVTLFPTASGIIVERGSLLSHSAIVSREMGIPCIVGVTGLLKTLKTGDLVEMNGSTGTIKIIGHE